MKEAPSCTCSADIFPPVWLWIRYIWAHTHQVNLDVQLQRVSMRARGRSTSVFSDFILFLSLYSSKLFLLEIFFTSVPGYNNKMTSLQLHSHFRQMKTEDNDCSEAQCFLCTPQRISSCVTAVLLLVQLFRYPRSICTSQIWIKAGF